MTKSRAERRKLVALMVIAVLAVLLRFFRLGHQSFWLDEVLTIGSYSSPGGGVPYGVKLLWDVHGPLYSLVMHFWSVTSSSEAWLRAPGATAGVATVLLTYFWLKRELGERTALTAALLMAVNPFNIYYSQELRFYSLLSMFVVLSLLVFSHFRERPSFRTGLILGMVLGLACLSHFMAIFLCVGLATYMVVTGRFKGAHLRYGLLAAAVAFIMVSPWIYRELFFIIRIRAVEESSRPVVYRMEGSGPSAIMSYPYIMFAFAMGFSYGPDLRELHETTGINPLILQYWPQITLAAVLFGTAAVSGIVRLLWQRRAALFLAIPIATIMMVTVAAVLKIKVINARYVICAFPIFIAIIAHGSTRWKRMGYVLPVTLTLLMLYSVMNYHFVPRYFRDDLRAAIHIVEDSSLPGDVIIAPGMQPVVEHYYRGDRPVETIYASHLDREVVENSIRLITEGRRRIWFILCRPWDTDAEGNASAYLEENLIRTGGWEMPGVTLVLYEMPAGAR